MSFFLFPHSVAAVLLTLTIVSFPTSKAENELKIGSLHVGRILFLGNSITLHGPAPNIGWTGNWGMAASARENDYVHLLLDQITKSAGGTPKVMIRNIADFERQLTAFNIRDTLKEELAFQANVVVLAIGENTSIPKSDEARKQFSSALDDLLAQLKGHGNPTIFVRSQFWPETEKDSLLKKACNKAGCVYVDIGKLANEQANFARSERQIEHAGVAGHPGDKGMSAIAEELWKAMKQGGEVKK